MPATSQTGQNLIDNFEQDTGDTTELSATAELALANKIYRKILNDREWNFLKKAATGTAVTANSVTTITMPADFDRFCANNASSDPEISISSTTQYGNGRPIVIFLATTSGTFAPYQVINFSDRRQYRNQNGYCYYDMVNNQVVFTAVPPLTDLSYEFDYLYGPDDIALATTPKIPAQFQDVIHHGMAIDDTIFQLFDRAHSYAAENKVAYDDWLSQLRFWDSQFNFS